MFSRLLALFIGVPLIEMLILIKLGESLGFWPTIGLVIVTGILGAALARIQGYRVWVKIQQELQAGRMPGGPMLDGLLILCAGIVLLTPGLLTDIVGFILLIPPSRVLIKSWLKKILEKKLKEQSPTPTDYIDV